MKQNQTTKYVVTQRVFLAIVLLIETACDNFSSEIKTDQNLLPELSESCVISMSAHPGKGQSDKGIQKYQQLLSDKPSDIQHVENLGWAYVNKAQTSFDPGFYKLAEQTVACMNHQQPDTLAALLLQGHILHNLHRFKEAEVIARQLVETRGYWYDFGLLGDALMEQGELVAAIAAYQEMMDQKPGPQAYNRAAYMRWLKGDVEGAIELLSLSVNSQAGQHNSSTAWALTRLADYEFQAGHIDTSLNYLSALLEKQPDYAPALLVLGRIKMAQGLMDSAVDILTHALQLNPLPEYRWALIEALSEKDEKQQKRAELEQQLFQTGATEDRRTYALYLSTTGIDTETALSLAEQELQLRHDVMTLDTYAWALRSNHQFKEATEYSTKALNEGTRSARLFYHAGVIANENGQKPEAKRLLKQAKELENGLWPSERRHLNQIL